MENEQEQQKKPSEPIIKVVDLGTQDPIKLKFEKAIYFEYDSPLDGLLVGNLVFHKMNIGAIGKKGNIKAQLNGGVPLQDIDPLVDALNDKVAHLTVWFEGTENLPAWAKDLRKLHDPVVINSLFMEGASFEATFR